MVLTLDKKVEEKLKQIKKAMEVVGGKAFIESFNCENDLYSKIVLDTLSNGAFIFSFNGKEYTMDALLKAKNEYEKHLIKNKSKVVTEVIYKINNYGQDIESKIRKYKKSQSFEIFKDIESEINKRYGKILDKHILSFVNDTTIDDIDFSSDKYYGEYLEEKKKEMILLIFKKLSI